MLVLVFFIIIAADPLRAELDSSCGLNNDENSKLVRDTKIFEKRTECAYPFPSAPRLYG
jgi:hypothetical protein